MNSIVNLAVVALITFGATSVHSVGEDLPTFDDHFWELVQGSGPITTVFGAEIQANNVISLETSPTGNVTAVIRARHPWIESMGGTAHYQRPDGTYDTITLIY